MHEESWRVRFSECDKEQKLTYHGIVNYFQDCSNLQSESLGLGFSHLRGKNRAWILDFWQIVIEKRPECFDWIRVATWANGFKGFFGIRNFTMKSESGELLAYANSYWVYMDTLTGRPVRVDREEAERYSMEAPLEMECLGRKIEIPDDMQLIDETAAQAHSVDLYHHMNNGRYIELASDYLPDDGNIRQICCQYKKQARRGNLIKVYRNITEKRTTIVLKDTDDSIYAVVSFDRE